MGLTISCTVTCDKCTLIQATLPSENSPPPDQWMIAQGYANIFAGASASPVGRFCPTCIQTYGTKSLVKTAADLCADLTDPPQQ